MSGNESEKPDRDESAQAEQNDDRTLARQEYEVAGLGDRSSDSEPDVFLDVPVVKVDEINLEVEDLRARVSLQAEVLDLVKLNVGADVELGRVSLGIHGVEAQALLKVRLDNVAGILDRVLTTIDRNPQILEHITRGVESAVRDVGGGAGQAVGELGRGAGEAVEDVGAGAGKAVEDVGEGAGEAVEDVGGGAGKAVEDVGEGAGKAAEQVGGTAEETGRRAGEAASGQSGTARPRESRSGDRGTQRTGKSAGRQPSGKSRREPPKRPRPSQRRGRPS